MSEQTLEIANTQLYQQIIAGQKVLAKFSTDGINYLNVGELKVQPGPINNQYLQYYLHTAKHNLRLAVVYLPVKDHQDLQPKYQLLETPLLNVQQLQYIHEQLSQFTMMQKPQEFLSAWLDFVQARFSEVKASYLTSLQAFNRHQKSLVTAMTDDFMLEEDRSYYAHDLNKEDVVRKYRINHITTKKVNIDVSTFLGTDEEEMYAYTETMDKLSVIDWLLKRFAFHDTYESARIFGMQYYLVRESINSFKSDKELEELNEEE